MGTEGMNVTPFTLPCDLSEASFADACGQLDVEPQKAILIAPTTEVARVQLIADKYRCDWFTVPPAMLKTEFTWGVADNRGNYIWSQGV